MTSEGWTCIVRRRPCPADLPAFLLSDTNRTVPHPQSR